MSPHDSLAYWLAVSEIIEAAQRRRLRYWQARVDKTGKRRPRREIVNPEARAFAIAFDRRRAA